MRVCKFFLDNTKCMNESIPKHTEALVEYVQGPLKGPLAKFGHIFEPGRIHHNCDVFTKRAHKKSYGKEWSWGSELWLHIVSSF